MFYLIFRARSSLQVHLGLRGKVRSKKSREPRGWLTEKRSSGGEVPRSIIAVCGTAGARGECGRNASGVMEKSLAAEAKINWTDLGEQVGTTRSWWWIDGSGGPEDNLPRDAGGKRRCGLETHHCVRERVGRNHIDGHMPALHVFLLGRLHLVGL